MLRLDLAGSARGQYVTNLVCNRYTIGYRSIRYCGWIAKAFPYKNAAGLKNMCTMRTTVQAVHMYR